MDFSWGWVKPRPVVTTETLARARLELARMAMLQAMRHRIVGSRPAPERRRGQGSHQRPRLPAFPA
jgi:hypothetical protein